MNFYEENYKEFSDTRFSIWDKVKEFSKYFEKDSYVLDAGCGNGKNMIYLKDKCNIIGLDNCKNFIKLCKDRKLNVKEGDILNLPFEKNTFDFIISIAVIHHLTSESDRIKAINEMIRVLKPNGQILISVWAYESDKFSNNKKFIIGNNIVKFNNKERFYYIYDFTNFKNLLKNFNSQIIWNKGNWYALIKYPQY